MTGDQFARIVEGLHSGLSDLSLVHEGTLRSVPPGRTVDQALDDPDRPATTFQGWYAYRRGDGATRLEFLADDTELRPPEQLLFLHVILAGRLESVGGSAGSNARPSASAGVPGSLNLPGSPERILDYWALRDVAERVRDGFRWNGWETVDGARCARVEFPQAGTGSDGEPTEIGVRYWLDLARGAQPLKVEFYDPKGVRMRIERIRLARYTVGDGQTLWIPTSGVCLLYQSQGGRYPDQPVGVESYHVVDGSVRLNRGLPDEVFKIPGRVEPHLDQPALRARFDAFRRYAPPTDPEGHREHLAGLEREMDQHLPRVHAPPPDRPAAERRTWIQAALVLVGLTLIGLAIAAKLRTSG
jgi:hypothetical protein